jgi:hypothetical protein
MTTLEVTYTVKRSDIAWMYLGSWAAKIAAVPGLLVILIGLPTNPKFPLSEALGFMAFGAVCVVAGPLLLLWMLMGMYGTNRLIGHTVKLHISSNGVRGWPPAEDVPTTWQKIRRIHRLRGVITLPFQKFGTRAGWIPIPERALSSEELATLHTLLRDKGVMKR